MRRRLQVATIKTSEDDFEEVILLTAVLIYTSLDGYAPLALTPNALVPVIALKSVNQ